MVEGWVRHLKGDMIEAYSAGIETHDLNPLAVKVMAEAGVDISQQQSKLVNDMLQLEWDYVVTVCGHAHETCSVFPRKAEVIHVGFDDPPAVPVAVRALIVAAPLAVPDETEGSTGKASLYK